MTYKVSSGTLNLCSLTRNNILLAEGSRCWTNLSASGAVQEYDVITLTCSIKYSGNWAPVTRWFNSATLHNYTTQNNSQDTLLTANGSTTFTSQLTIVASGDLHGCQIVCVTNFSSKPPYTTATNIPSYTYTWMSRKFNVILRCKFFKVTMKYCAYV